MSEEERRLQIDQRLRKVAQLLTEIDEICGEDWLFAGSRALAIRAEVDDWICNREFNAKFGNMRGLTSEEMQNRYEQIESTLSRETLKWLHERSGMKGLFKA